MGFLCYLDSDKILLYMYIINTIPEESALYGIYALVVFVSEHEHEHELVVFVSEMVRKQEINRHAALRRFR